jgi:hypothetical protein
MSNNLNNSFAFYGGLMLLAGFLCVPIVGSSSPIIACIVCYFMLVSVNAIGRGEKKAYKKMQQKRSRS